MKKPRLCFVGPMIGRNPGEVTTQGERLAELFAHAGYPVIAVSSAPTPQQRLTEIVLTLARRRRELDVIVMQVFSGRSFVVDDIASWIAKRLRLPIIMVLRGGNLPQFSQRHPAWVKRVLARADTLVAPTEYLARAFRGTGRPVVVIPNVIDARAYRHRLRTSAAPRLFWMRAFHPIYNPELAVKVLARVRAALPDATLTMGGSDKGSLKAVKQLAETLGVSGAIRYVGFLDMLSKIAEFDKADIYLNTNRIDNTPVSVIEACAMGLAVVATRVGGVVDLLSDERTGLLVADDDDAGMAAAVLRLIQDETLMRQLSANGRVLAESCDGGAIMPGWEALVRAVDERRAAA